MKLLVGLPEKAYEGKGGAYYPWTSSKMPVLGETKVGAAKLVLQPKGFAIPHYADSSKIAFVVQSSAGAVAGLVPPNSKKETVVKLKKGDSFTVEKGVVSWWYNGGDSLLEVVFLGETADAIVPGEFTYLFLSGTNGLLRSFSADFISKLYKITVDEANQLATSQTGQIIVKLYEGWPANMISATATHQQECFNFGDEVAKLKVVDGGSIKTFTSGEDDKVKVGTGPGAELCAFDIELQPNAAFPPMYMASPAVQVLYVARGSCWVQIVSGSGGLELDQHLEAGYLFVVPKFYTVAIVAGEEGLQCFSLVTTSKPMVGQIANTWSALLPGGALQAALNLNLKAEKAPILNVERASIINTTQL